MPLKWEFPGGKVEAGESPRGALAREIVEELGLALEVGDLLATGFSTAGTAPIRLDVYLATVVGGDLVLHEHDRAEWYGAAQLPSLDWAPADLPAVRALCDHLSSPGPLRRTGK